MCIDHHVFNSKAAGPSVQAECKNVAPSGVTPGEVVKTSGGNLKVKAVLHGAIEDWDGDNGQGPKV